MKLDSVAIVDAIFEKYQAGKKGVQILPSEKAALAEVIAEVINRNEGGLIQIYLCARDNRANCKACDSITKLMEEMYDSDNRRET